MSHASLSDSVQMVAAVTNYILTQSRGEVKMNSLLIFVPLPSLVGRVPVYWWLCAQSSVVGEEIRRRDCHIVLVARRNIQQEISSSSEGPQAPLSSHQNAVGI